MLLVTVSVVVGARLLATADDTTPVWAVSTDLGPGDAVTTEDLVAQRVRFADEEDLAGYFAATSELPQRMELLRGVGAGELLPRAAVGEPGAGGTVEVPLAVAATQVPPAVGAGSVVDVYVRSSGPGGDADAAGGEDRRARASGRKPALAAVTVVDLPTAADTLGGGGERQLVLAVDEADVGAFLGLLGGVENPVVTVVRRA